MIDTKVLKPDRVLDGLKLYSLLNIEQTFHMGRWTVKKYLKELNITPIRLGKRLYITNEDLKRVLTRRQ